MFLPAGKKELSGAMVVACGLILGGVVSLAARHFNLSTPGLLAVPSERELLERAVATPEDHSTGATASQSAGGSVREGSAPGVMAGSEPAARRGRRLGPIDLNNADAKQLEALEGVGPALAARIIELRAKKGGRFRSMRELLEVRGIGPVTLERIKASATLGPPEGDGQNIALRKSTSSHADSSSFQR